MCASGSYKVLLLLNLLPKKEKSCMLLEYVSVKPLLNESILTMDSGVGQNGSRVSES